jgi:hypothetical protein
VAALDPTPASAAPADVNVELTVDRLTGNLDLVLAINVGWVNEAAAVRASIRQGHLMDFVDLFGRGREAMGLAAVAGAGFAARLLGLGLWRPFGEGRGLTLAGALLLFEQAGQPLYLGLQCGDTPLECLATGTGRFLHLCMVANERTGSCARGKVSSAQGRQRR